jgi:hypothetical protein
MLAPVADELMTLYLRSCNLLPDTMNVIRRKQHNHVLALIVATLD